MKYTTIRIEGSILSPDILEKIDSGEQSGQLLKDFNLSDKYKNLKEFINVSWAKSLSQWEIFKNELEDLSEKDAGTTTTRKHWIIPLLDFMGYKSLEFSSHEEINNKKYGISHREENSDGFPVHIISFKDSLDKKKEGRYSVSPHSMVQEYLNITEHLYAIITNGKTLRILRDSSRLVKLSFVEFDLERMFDDKNFTDFALMFRLIHASRMPQKMELAAESILEKYHQNSLDLGSTIRKGLSACVKESIEIFAQGFLTNPDNTELKEKIISGEISDQKFYGNLLNLIYRILFLMVIEERDLVYPQNSDRKKKEIYYNFYSVNKLRNLSIKTHTYNKRYRDLWMSLLNTFKLFESEKYGDFLNIKPLSGSLFSESGIGEFNHCYLDNECLLTCFEKLSYFWNENIKQKTKINYASLNVEEFGSVYEGLLEYETKLIKYTENDIALIDFELVKSDERSASGSHYTPDELVQPLIKNSLDHIIEEKLKEKDKEKALLSIRVCDVACGSGHILLSAARRIATDVAKIRSGEDQPSPSAYREAIRLVINTCIYGVDKNPLAVELCKVALWLEAHNPNEPLNFLDHHIKCGDAIVGLAHKEELENGIADEAFKKLAGDDSEVTTKLIKRNREQRKKRSATRESYQNVYNQVDNFAKSFSQFQKLPETNIEEINHKQREYIKIFGGDEVNKIRILADMQVAQFFIPKTFEYETRLVTDFDYSLYLSGKNIEANISGLSQAISQDKKFFHWFLEFPEIFVNGGFDCILGNPPYLGGTKISSNYGLSLCNYLYKNFDGCRDRCDLVTYFVRRDFELISKSRYIGLITTDGISSGDTLVGGLDRITKSSTINFAIKSTPWLGEAATNVSLFTIYKGFKNFNLILDGKAVNFISSNLTDIEFTNMPKKLTYNLKTTLGIKTYNDGFILDLKTYNSFLSENVNIKEVVHKWVDGDDLNSMPNQWGEKYVINLNKLELNDAIEKYPSLISFLEKKVKPERENLGEEKNWDINFKKNWWIHADKRIPFFNAYMSVGKIYLMQRAAKYLNITKQTEYINFSDNIIGFLLEDFMIAILHSTIHNEWAWFFSKKTGGSTIRYSIKSCLNTFPLPVNILEEIKYQLGNKIESYIHLRKALMFKMKLGLTDTYNLFHTKDLSIDEVIKKSKQDLEICESAYKDIIELRKLHKEMDNIVLKAYGWTDIDLAHDFYEVDYLPEKDRVRYTISPEIRKEILKRLLLLNHEIHEMEERGEKINSILNSEKDLVNSEKEQGVSAHSSKQQSLFDEPEQITMFD